MVCEAVIFDMDGVLVDSEPMHFATTNEILARRGARLERVEYDGYLGMAEVEFFARLVERFDLTEPPERLARERVEASLAALSSGELLPMEGALESLILLRADGRRLALASSATRAQVGLVLDAFGLRTVFAAVVSAQDVARGKPAPDLFLEAASRLRVEPANCVVIEDAPLGVRAARAAGMVALALVPPGRDPAPHLAEGAARCLPSLTELQPDLLDEVSGPAGGD